MVGLQCAVVVEEYGDNQRKLPDNKYAKMMAAGDSSLQVIMAALWLFSSFRPPVLPTWYSQFDLMALLPACISMSCVSQNLSSG